MSWEPRNLANVEERPAILPNLGGVGLVYPGKRHVFSGPPESAKTIAAYAVAIEVARAGAAVLVIDFEMGPYDARDRLRELGATDDDLQRILYVEPETPATKEIVSELIEKWHPALVIVDASAGAFDLQGLDDNKRADVERFAGIYVRLFFLRGIATITVDHVVKDARSRNGFVIGSERKVGGADVHLGFETVKPLHRGGRGVYRIVTRKDRLGHLPRPTAAKLEFVSHPETHAITWALSDSLHDEDGDTFRPTVLMERVSRHLELQGEPVSRNSVETMVSGKNDYIRVAMDVLVREGYVHESAGLRKARLVESVRPFRELDLAPTSPRDFAPDFAPEESLNDAGLHFAPTSPLTSSRDFAPPNRGPTRPQGGEVVDGGDEPVGAEALDDDIPF